MKTQLVTEKTWDVIWIGRPGPFGNPYKKGPDGTRDEVVAKHKKWLAKDAQTALRDRIRRELQGKKLYCPCGHGGKKACHGQTLVQTAETVEFLERPVNTFKQFKLFCDPSEDDAGIEATTRIERFIETTKQSSAEHPGRRGWIRFRESRICTPDRLWIFTDGSTSGWHAAKIVRPGVDVRSLARLIPMTPTRNVGAELNGVLLGLKNAPDGAKVTLVTDFLNGPAWITGAYKINGEEIAEKIARAKQLIEGSRLSISFCHHGGHQKDHSHFTHFNCGVDELCSSQTSVDYVTPWDKAFETKKYAKATAVDEDSKTD